MALDLRNLSIRTVSGLVYAGLLIGVIVCGPLASAILLAIFAIIASWELESNVIEPENPEKWSTTWLLDAAILAVLIFFPGVPEGNNFGLPVYFCLLGLRFIIQIFIGQKDPLRSIAVTGLEQLYIGVPLFLFVLIIEAAPNPWIIVCVLSMIWINDTGAYIVGSLIGRHKMLPKLSPKKSWEGFLGGIVFNIGAAFIFSNWFRLDSLKLFTTASGWIYIGICVSVLATLGDLFESMLKRSLGIKDFGSIIPGHGGILDRIDSLLFVIPGLTIAVFLGFLITQSPLPG